MGVNKTPHTQSLCCLSRHRAVVALNHAAKDVVDWPVMDSHGSCNSSELCKQHNTDFVDFCAFTVVGHLPVTKRLRLFGLHHFRAPHTFRPRKPWSSNLLSLKPHRWLISCPSRALSSRSQTRAGNPSPCCTRADTRHKVPPLRTRLTRAERPFRRPGYGCWSPNHGTRTCRRVVVNGRRETKICGVKYSDALDVLLYAVNPPLYKSFKGSGFPFRMVFNSSRPYGGETTTADGTPARALIKQRQRALSSTSSGNT